MSTASRRPGRTAEKLRRSGHDAGQDQEDQAGIVHRGNGVADPEEAFAEQTNDLDSSDYDSYFFKCRAGKEDGGCCGASAISGRTSSRLRARLWGHPDGEFLGVRPPEGGGRKRKRPGPLGVLTSPWFAMALLLLIGFFLYFYRPKLAVTPAEWAGPLGSRIEYKVEDHRWFFFNRDVTPLALAQSNDPQVLNSAAAACRRRRTSARLRLLPLRRPPDRRLGRRWPAEAAGVAEDRAGHPRSKVAYRFHLKLQSRRAYAGKKTAQ